MFAQGCPWSLVEKLIHASAFCNPIFRRCIYKKVAKRLSCIKRVMRLEWFTNYCWSFTKTQSKFTRWDVRNEGEEKTALRCFIFAVPPTQLCEELFFFLQQRVENISSNRVLWHLHTALYEPFSPRWATICFFFFSQYKWPTSHRGCQSSKNVLILRREGREIYRGQGPHIIVRLIWGCLLLTSSAAFHNTPVAVVVPLNKVVPTVHGVKRGG